MGCMIVLILSLKKYLTLTRIYLEGKRRRDVSYWIILKTIMLGLKKNKIIKDFETLILSFELEICGVLI